MRIVVLDGYTLNPGDLSWASLEALGDCTVHDRSTPDQVVPRAAGAEIVLTNKVEISDAFMAELPDMKYIGVLATGYNIVDITAAHRRDIVVSNIPTYGTDSVAQMVFAHTLNLVQRVAQHSDSVKAGDWSRVPDFCYWQTPLIELADLTMGIVGIGRIGGTVARIAQAFGMNVIAHDPFAPQAPSGVIMVELDELFATADVVSLHCPLTPENTNFVNADLLAKMKPTAFIINTSRGPLIDAHALADALNRDVIAGAGIDVLPVEPPPADHPLYAAKNCFITPHISWATRAARSRLMDVGVDNARAFLDGNPQNVVKPS
ncbi:MAG: glycerate dehydrogenase [Planctomycetaceae bacterium]|nr:glycerate dehydrogenase [Planctomycetaceae bacterium]